MRATLDALCCCAVSASLSVQSSRDAAAFHDPTVVSVEVKITGAAGAARTRDAPQPKTAVRTAEIRGLTPGGRPRARPSTSATLPVSDARVRAAEPPTPAVEPAVPAGSGASPRSTRGRLCSSS